MQRIFVTLISLSLLISIGGYLNTFRKTDPDVSNKPAETIITVKVLVDNFLIMRIRSTSDTLTGFLV